MEERNITQEEENMLSEYTKEQNAVHWTKNYLIKPALLSTVYGDGKKLIFLYPMDDRPNHYLILVDSKTNTTSDEWYNLLDDEIYEAIGSEFGDYDDELEEDDKDNEFPAFSFGCGMSWNSINIRKIK